MNSLARFNRESKRHNPLNEASVLFHKALMAYDWLLFEHGYTFERLDAITRFLAESYGDIEKVYAHIIKLRDYVRENNISHPRSTTAREEIQKAYINTPDKKLSRWITYDDDGELPKLIIMDCNRIKSTYQCTKNKREGKSCPQPPAKQKKELSHAA